MSTPLTVTPEDIKAIAAAQKWHLPYINASKTDGGYQLSIGESYGGLPNQDRRFNTQVNGTFTTYGDLPPWEYTVSSLSRTPGDQLSHVAGHVITLTNLLRLAAKDGGKAVVWIDFTLREINHPVFNTDTCTIRVHRRSLDVNGNTIERLVGLQVIEKAIYQNNGAWGASMLYKAW